MPVREIAALCRRYGAEVCVDGAQGVGAVPIHCKSWGIHYLSFCGYKWLMGPVGTGALFVDRECVQRLTPTVAGWLSGQHATDFLAVGPDLIDYSKPIRTDASFIEGGNPNMMGYVGLDSAATLIGELGVGAVHQHILELLDRLESGLVERGFATLRARRREAQSGILSVHVPRGMSSTSFAALLESRGVACSGNAGVLRFAPHWPNSHGEVEEILQTVDECIRA
jgi:selenocysteine lyase/cysteine desulfurase